MSNALPPDAAERARALDTTRSFLVQAPAGAGKTELLVRRYLALLARVDEPEEILAVTFTRKAAAEMQDRVMRALATRDDAGAGVELQALVAAVRRRDQERGWRLASFPARLRINTLDALNSSLARSVPLTAGANVLRPIAPDAPRLYQLAARASLRRLADGDRAGAAVADLLQHLDNSPGVAEDLLATLLARRDQWLPLVGITPDPEAVRQVLEQNLARVVEARLAQVPGLMAPARFEELVEVAQAAALNLDRELKSPLVAGCSLADRHAWWQFTTGMLLTKEGEWRKKVDKNTGFPPDQKDLKAHVMALLAGLQEIPGLLPAMAGVQRLPPPHYPPAQWRALRALLLLLPEAAAELKLVFAAENATDYIEVAIEGRAALGEDMAPSELALRLDWRLRHILLDEFQDTSATQYALLEALTRGWSVGDGRTLFLVGDPMQSIYRFRQAEVGLFIDVREHGLQDLHLEFLQLRANFRAVPALVAWANDAFPHIFPRNDDIMSGAIAFAGSVPTRAEPGADPPGSPSAVSVHPGNWQCPGGEASTIVAIVRDSLSQWPGQTIGILVRSRSHATELVRALRGAGIPLAADELVSLKQSVLAHDLLAITRALVHAGDRLAWISVLRAPWCGLSLADLEILCTTDTCAGGGEQALWERIQATSILERLSADGRERLPRLQAAFAAGLDRLGRIPLRDVVEGVWMDLGGPLVAGRELPLLEQVLAAIDRHDVDGDCPDTLALAATLEGLHGSLPDATARVHVMTIHKAKGLEFDTVILPGLGRRVQVDKRRALLWQHYLDIRESGNEDGNLDPDERALLLAPVNPRGDDDDPLYEMLWELHERQQSAEIDRLLYVAVTRARERLHLLGQLRPARGARKPSADDAPAPGSLLERLWRKLGPGWPIPAAAPGDAEVTDDDPTAHWQQPPLRRLCAGWRRPEAPPGLKLRHDGSAAVPRDLPVYDWVGAWTRHAGSVAHRLLQQIATGDAGSATDAGVESLAPRIRALLLREGVGLESLEAATGRVSQVLRMAIADGKFRWLAGPRADQHNEWAITTRANGRFERVIIDRAFVDDDNIRWIIDYKTSSHEGGDRQAFIESEVRRYAGQLRLYRDTLAKLEHLETRTALYFPLLQHLQLVDADGTPLASDNPGESA